MKSQQQTLTSMFDDICATTLELDVSYRIKLKLLVNYFSQFKAYGWVSYEDSQYLPGEYLIVNEAFAKFLEQTT